MKRFIVLILSCLIFLQPALAFGTINDSKIFNKKSEKAILKLINLQTKYANKNDFDKFIATYDKDYLNSDGFDLEIYSQLVKDIWSSYTNLKYNIKVKKITVDGDTASAEVEEITNADLVAGKSLKGELKSEANSIYYLKKINGAWKVTSDAVVNETTSMLYGEARDLDITLKVPQNVKPNEEYSAMLEFVPPVGSVAIASIASDKVEYPQKQTKEVFRTLPEDNILERLFTANDESLNEYIVASIGLTKTDICDISIKLSLSGFGYVIKRVNVVNPNLAKEIENEQTK